MGRINSIKRTPIPSHLLLSFILSILPILLSCQFSYFSITSPRAKMLAT